jgi:hypothetical protein
MNLFKATSIKTVQEMLGENRHLQRHTTASAEHVTNEYVLNMLEAVFTIIAGSQSMLKEEQQGEKHEKTAICHQAWAASGRSGNIFR